MMHTTFHRQDGAVLIVALFFLLLLSLVVTTTTETNSQQLKMAGNEQSRVEAQQRVMSAIDAIIDDTDNTPVIGDVGFKICATGSSDGSCDSAIIGLSSAVTTVPTSTQLSYHVTRMGPLETSPPVMREEQASSSSFYRVARYEVTSSYVGAPARLGNSRIVQGMLVKIPATSN